MDLGEQANDALNALLDADGVVATYTERRIARMMWLQGFKAGMDATTAKVDEAFAKWTAAQV